MIGWIKLQRKLLTWEWFKTANMVHLFIYLLLKANHIKGYWQGVEIKRGQLITGIKSLHNETNISEQTLRTCLKRLEKTEEINIQSTNKYSIITIINYESYQDEEIITNNPANKQLTNNQQATNKQLTTNKNNKELKNKENKEKVKPILEFCSNYFKEEYILSSEKIFIDLLNIDKFNIEQIKTAILNAIKNDFWKQQFLSPAKLRKQNKDGVKYIDVFLNLSSAKNNKPEPQKETFANKDYSQINI